MTPQERELIEGLFQRLKAADTPQKDREAEDLINHRTIEVPAAPYLLVQTALVQDHALAAAQQRISQLEKELEATKAAGGSTSFLGGLLGGGRWNQGAAAPPPGAAAPSPPRSSVPITAPAAAPSPTYAAAAPAGGGFLQSALTTAAGVAGGALLFEGLSSLLFHRPGPFSPYVGTGLGGSPWGAGGGNVYETNVVNNYGTPQPDQNPIDTSGGADPNASEPDLRDASYDPPDSSDFDDSSGGDFGGGGDTSV